MGNKCASLKWKNELIKELLEGKTNMGEKERNILYTIMDLEDFMEKKQRTMYTASRQGKDHDYDEKNRI